MRLDASNSDLFVYTEREGALSAVGHDLKFRVSDFRIELSPDEGTGEVEIDAASLAVVGAVGTDGRVDLDSPSKRDRAKIESNVQKEVLRTARFPQIRAWIHGIDATSEEGFALQVELELVGKRGRLTVPLRRHGDRWVAQTILRQSDFGIEPYRTFLGALRLKDEVRVELTTARELGSELRGGS